MVRLRRRRCCNLGSAFITLSLVCYFSVLCMQLLLMNLTSRNRMITSLNGLPYFNHDAANGSCSSDDAFSKAPISVLQAGCYDTDDCSAITCKKLLGGDVAAIAAARSFMEKHARLAVTDDQISKLASNCTNMQQRGGYIMAPLRPSDVDFPIAFTLLLHWHLEQFERLLRAIYRPQNIYCVHIDAKASQSFHSAVASITRCFPNVFLVTNPQYVIYTGFSRLQADIECMKDHLMNKVKWHYLLNVAGQSYPLRTPEEMVDILRIYNGANDIEGIHGSRRLVQRYRKQWQENRTSGVRQTGQTNPPPPHELDIVRGSAYGVFSREFVEFIIHDRRAKDLLDWSRQTYSPDEHYWATLHHTYSNPHLRTPGGYSGIPDKKPFLAVFVKWSSNRDKCFGKWVHWVCILGVGDLHDIMTRREFFVNKFDIEYDSLAFECTEAWLNHRVHCPLSVDTEFYRSLSFVVAHNSH